MPRCGFWFSFVCCQSVRGLSAAPPTGRRSGAGPDGRRARMVGVRSGASGDLVTGRLMIPVMKEWMLQWYEQVPGLVKVNL